MRYRYNVELNGGAKHKCETYMISYGSTSDIKLLFNGNGISISFSMGKIADLEDKKGYLYKVIRESIRRGIILFYIKSGSAMKLKSAHIRVVDEKQSIEIANKDVFDNLEFGCYLTGAIEVTDGLKDYEFLKTVLSGKKEEFDSKSSAISAYISSRFRKSAEDKFRDLWMAFNGMYLMIYDKNDDNERGMLWYFVEKFNLGNYVLTKKERNETKGKIINLFEQINVHSFTKDVFDENSGAYKMISEFIKKNYKNANTTPAGFLITAVAYLIRCDFFHSHRPVPLIWYAEDVYLKAVECMTNLLELIIEENMIECYRLRDKKKAEKI